MVISSINPSINNYNNSIRQNGLKRNLNPSFTHKNLIVAENTSNKKINHKEGAKLILEGAKNQVIDTLREIADKPFRSLAFFGATTAGIMALPLIGIPSAVGGGVLAIGFAGLAIGKTISHVVDFTKNNKLGTYDKARNNLKDIGGDSLDLALSVPFVPKGIHNLKTFTQYGKLGINSSLISEIKNTKGSFNKLKALLVTDKEMFRSMNYESALDKNLKAARGLSEAEKATIRKDLLELNVPDEQINELIMDKWATARGVKTKPDIQYATMNKHTSGFASGNDCTIFINDYKHNVTSETFGSEIVNKVTTGDDYLFTFRDSNTGQFYTETISKQLYDGFIEYSKRYNDYSKQARKILTLAHEREHIHQFGEYLKMKGLSSIELSPRGKELYSQMLQELPTVDVSSVKGSLISHYLDKAKHSDLTSYIKRIIEIGARDKETTIMDKPGFNILDKVYRTINKNVPMNTYTNATLNDIRYASGKN